MIIAHRAMTPGAIENTIPAIAAAAVAGADLIELDIRLSLDRQPFVLHDAFLRREVRSRGWVRLWPSWALRRFRHRGDDDGIRVAPLDEVLRVIPEDVQAALHLKDRAALSSVLKTVRKHGDPGRTWLWLEDMRDVQRATRSLPEVRCTLLRPTGARPEHLHRYLSEARWAGASAISVPWNRVESELVTLAHQFGLLVFSRLTTFESLDERLAAGIDGIITDDPRKVVERVEGDG